MHVLLTVNSAFNLVNFRAGLIRALVADGHRVTTLAPEDAHSPRLADLGARALPLEMDCKGISPARDAGLALRLRRVFRRERPDIVLSFTIKNNIYGALAARSLGIPFIPNVSGLGTAFLSGGAMERLVTGLYRTAFRALPVVFFQNTDDRDLFVAKHIVEPGQARLLPGSGVDIGRFRPTPLPSASREGPVFLFIGRLLRDKGVLELVEAARRLRAAHPSARVQLLGAVGAENRTAIDAETVRGWVAEGAVEHLGTTEDVRPVIAGADSVVLPSYREGTPRTLLEAAAMARPLVATDVPGCRHVVEDGVNGYLCAVRDAASLTAAMQRIVAMTPDERVRMGTAGRDRIEQDYSEQTVIDCYRAAILDLAVTKAA